MMVDPEINDVTNDEKMFGVDDGISLALRIVVVIGTLWASGISIK